MLITEYFLNELRKDTKIIIIILVSRQHESSLFHNISDNFSLSVICNFYRWQIKKNVSLCSLPFAACFLSQ